MKKKLFILSIISIFAVSCYKYPNINVSDQDQDISISIYNNDTDFSSYSTFQITDTVSFIYSKNGDVTDSILKPADAAIYIQTVKNNMIALGYMEINDGSADLFMDINIINDVDAGVYLNVAYPGWGWGYGGWGGYWGGYYGGWYYPYYYPTTYYNSVGTILIDMIDLNQSEISTETGEEYFEAQWSGIIKGLLNNSNPTNNRITTRINECFDQSPYLNINN